MFLNDIEYNWIGKIPDHWKIKKIKHIFYIKKETATIPDEESVLSLTFDGIIKRDISTNEGQLPESYNGYTKIYPNDIVMNPMDLKSGWVDKSAFKGIISPSYFVLNKKNNKTEIDYYKYQFQRHYIERIFFPFGQGVSYEHRWGIGKETLLNFPIIVPPYDEQKLIASYLSSKIQNINRLINIIEKKIQLFVEGINSFIYYKSKEIEKYEKQKYWFQMKPNDWSILKFREIFEPISDKNQSEERLLSVHQQKGVVYRDEQEQNVMNPEGDLSNYKLVKPGDFVISLRSSEGGIEFSEVRGLVSPAYTVLRPKFPIDTIFYKYLLKSPNFIEEINRYISGIREGKSIHFRDIKNIPIPIKSQVDDRVVSKHRKLMTFIDHLNRRNNFLLEYRQAIISEVVTGKIDVRNWIG